MDLLADAEVLEADPKRLCNVNAIYLNGLLACAGLLATGVA
jgi:hypothetical protein